MEPTMMTHPSQLIELHRMQLDALNSLGHAVIAAAEKLSNLNLSASRQAIETATQPSIEQLMSYSRNLIGIGNGMQAEVARVVEAQLAETNRRVSALVEYAAKNAPAGSETAVSLLRGAVAAGNTAFDAVTKSARQATEWADANFAAAATASVIAAASAGAPTRSTKSAA
jgi:hypothetical protein